MIEHQRPLPRYIEKRDDKEGITEWIGDDTSYEIFAHLNLDWRRVEEICRQTSKPLGDLGSSFSTLPVEARMRGLDVVPIDIMHEYHRSAYSSRVLERFNNWKLQRTYNYDRPRHDLPRRIESGMGIKEPVKNYWGAVQEARDEVMKRYIVADLAHIPLADRSLGISIAHDSVPKHSPSLEVFLEEQLREILRITDQVACIYPLAMYRTVKKEASADDLEVIYTGEKVMRDVLEESRALYNEPGSLGQIREVAARADFDFLLAPAHEIGPEDPMHLSLQQLDRKIQKIAQLAVFTRRQ